MEVDEEEYWDEEEEERANDPNRSSPGADGIDDSHHAGTAEQIYHASLWPYRYLGIHCKPEDALDYDDRIYPRAGSRQGPKHQANVLPWPGKPVEFVKPLEVKKSGRKDGKPSKEMLAAIEADKVAREKRPKWVQDEPAGYTARGEDLDNDDPNNTAQLLWQPPEMTGSKCSDKAIDEYTVKVKGMTSNLGLPQESTNLLDVARDVLFSNKFDTEKSLKELPQIDISQFKEPHITAIELKKFEEGVTKSGSELYSVGKHVKSVKHADIVRFYYVWKKTSRGKQVWGNYSGRKGKKEARKAADTANKLQDDVADDHDDSAFDTEKAVERKKNFMCKFCSTKSSRQWRRAPNASILMTESSGKSNQKDKNNQCIIALCRRCAELWRRYAIQWEDMEELAKKVASSGGRAWKRRVDEELLKELTAANEMMSQTVYSSPAPTAQPSPATATASDAPPRKKLKTLADKEMDNNASDSGSVSGVTIIKKKEKTEKPAPPPVPEIPKPKVLPCAICQQLDPLGDQHLSCRECRLTVHRNCYGVLDNRHPGKWTCDMCANDKNPQVSIEYKCVLCPIEHTEHDFVEHPKMHTTKKKTEKDRERERTERENAQKAADYYRKKQEEMNRPVNPREPLKRTADNNWVHITCAMFTPEVKFGNAKALAPAEGIPSILRARYDEVCAVCKQQGGACVACHSCRTPVHVECAHQNGYLLGFDITPVKGSRRDQFNIVTINGESGHMTAAIWCKEHVPMKTIVHRMQDVVNEQGLNALQLYAQNYKQADLTLTGTVRKANLITLATRTSGAPAVGSQINRRASTTTVPASSTTAHRASISAEHSEQRALADKGDKVCITCGVDVSPKWWAVDKGQELVLTNGHSGSLGELAEAQKFVAQRKFQCHKCKKARRAPVPHVLPKREPSPPLPVSEPPRPLAAPTSVTSPPPLPIAEARDGLAHFGWAHPAQAGGHPPPPPLAPPVQAPISAPPPSHAQNGPPLAPPIAPPLAAPPPPPPPPAHHYPRQASPYGDWHRGAHAPSGQHINGSAPPVASNPPPFTNHLRDLRPPPIAPISHPPPPPPPSLHGHMSHPLTNGMPPSPRRGPPSMSSNTSPYMPAYHYPTHQPLHTLTNGGPPPRPADHFSLLPGRNSFSTPHGSPPSSRDGVQMSREPSLGNGPPPPPRQDDRRPTSGASASPSLRNLLS